MLIKLYLDDNCIYSLHLCSSLSGLINNDPGAPTVAPQCPPLHLKRTTGAAEKQRKSTKEVDTFRQLVICAGHSVCGGDWCRSTLAHQVSSQVNVLFKRQFSQNGVMWIQASPLLLYLDLKFHQKGKCVTVVRFTTSREWIKKKQLLLD